MYINPSKKKTRDSVYGVGRLPCAHCGIEDNAPVVVPYFVGGTNIKPIHAWLHPACSQEWHETRRSR